MGYRQTCSRSVDEKWEGQQVSNMAGWIVGVLIAGWLSLGMGGLGDTETVTKIPKPERSFQVELLDTDDVSFSLHDFSMDGLTMLPVKAGKANISLDFVEILEVRMYLQDDRVLAKVTFRKQSTSEFRVEPDLPFYGLTDWGKLRIQARDIRQIRFLGRADGPGEPDGRASPSEGADQGHSGEVSEEP